MLKINYIYHSGFLVEDEQGYYLFDYYQGDLPQLNPDKMLTIFVSHAHEDHFNPEIFSFAEKLDRKSQSVQYVLSYNIERKLKSMHLLELVEPLRERITFIRYDEEKEIPAGKYVGDAAENQMLPSAENKGENASLLVRTLKSTDQGVAFLVNTGSHLLYHAGDLYEWVRETDDKCCANDMRAKYRREIDKLSGQQLDLAFVPMDPILQSHYADGFTYFVEHVDSKCYCPMHMWNQYGRMAQWKMEHAGLLNRREGSVFLELPDV